MNMCISERCRLNGVEPIVLSDTFISTVPLLSQAHIPPALNFVKRRLARRTSGSESSFGVPLPRDQDELLTMLHQSVHHHQQTRLPPPFTE